MYLPDSLKIKLLENNTLNNDNLVPVVKLVLTGTNYTWLLAKIVNEEQQIAFGIFDQGNGIELGDIDLKRLTSTRGESASIVNSSTIFSKSETESPPISIDIEFEGKYPLAVYFEVAKQIGQIVADNKTHQDILEFWNKKLRFDK